MLNIEKEAIVELIEGDNRLLPSKVIQHVPSVKSQVLTTLTDEEVQAEVESNLRNVIDFGTMAIQNLSDLASQSEHPRPYEALATMIRSVTDTNVALAAMRKKVGIERGRDDGKYQELKVDKDTITASVSDLLDELDRKK